MTNPFLKQWISRMAQLHILYFCRSLKRCNMGSIIETPPQVVWTANRDLPVRESAVVTFFQNGNLVLTDADGSPVWSSNTAAQSVAGLRINKQGNLMLFNETNGTVWQSFDHPTDTLLFGQFLKDGQQLTSSISSKNVSSGLFYLCIMGASLSAYASGGGDGDGESHILYLRVGTDIMSDIYAKLKYVQFERGNLTLSFTNAQKKEKILETPSSISTQLLRLDADGGLRIYGWEYGNGWRVIHYFSNTWDECQFPLKCGRYGVCQDGQCTCPLSLGDVNFFVPVDTRFPNLGCSQNYHSSLHTSDHNSYKLVNFGELSYFSFFDFDVTVLGSKSEESCTLDCLLKESSCKAAFFLYYMNKSEGFCYLVYDVLSIIGTSISLEYNVSSYIKVHVPPLPYPNYLSPIFRILLLVIVTCTFVLLCVCASLSRLKRKRVCEDDVCLEKFLSETLLRFSYNELSTATENFSKRLGGGGYGQVFKGELRDGTEVAVKRLENGTGQGTKEFLAEVETVGNIHHINLVRLLGFCVENMHRIIVYEYMSNGSLDKWIFYENENASLDWKTRKKVLLDIAKGLAYIHEECRQRIAHLDVKPHNILLDDNFNEKVSDFGMSKLINRDESLVMTCIRGTLGYLAPEWQGSKITVKADVYSFGILTLEVVCGRMVLDYSQPESDIHLLKLLEKKSVENKLMDIVDNRCEDMRRNIEECLEMIKLGLWCLHWDYRRRPAMSSVAKVLEGSLELETNITYNFSSALSPVCPHANNGVAYTSVLASKQLH